MVPFNNKNVQSVLGPLVAGTVPISGIAAGLPLNTTPVSSLAFNMLQFDVNSGAICGDDDGLMYTYRTLW
jgi:hypothetical protein